MARGAKTARQVAASRKNIKKAQIASARKRKGRHIANPGHSPSARRHGPVKPGGRSGGGSVVAFDAVRGKMLSYKSQDHANIHSRKRVFKTYRRMGKISAAFAAAGVATAAYGLHSRNNTAIGVGASMQNVGATMLGASVGGMLITGAMARRSRRNIRKIKRDR